MSRYEHSLIKLSLQLSKTNNARKFVRYFLISNNITYTNKSKTFAKSFFPSVISSGVNPDNSCGKTNHSEDS